MLAMRRLEDHARGSRREGARGQAVLNGVTYPASTEPAWADELSHELLFFDAPPIASAAEVAFYHRASKTLLVRAPRPKS